jgi:hypothetical protein
LTKCEKFSLKINVFKDIPDLISKRSGNSSIYYKGSLYTFGGYNGKEFLNSVEKYNEKIN